jgi:hypothetical protein
VPGKIIPPMPGVARINADRGAQLREAGIQVIGHLVTRPVPPSQRLPLFDQVAGVRDEAGWGLDELVAAAAPGPAQDAVARAAGLMETAP